MQIQVRKHLSKEARTLHGGREQAKVTPRMGKDLECFPEVSNLLIPQRHCQVMSSFAVFRRHFL